LTSASFQTNVPAGFDVVPIIIPGLASIGQATGLTLRSRSKVTLGCSGNSDLSASASMTAQKVGALTASGNAAFS
jgi:hypothetical protein